MLSHDRDILSRDRDIYTRDREYYNSKVNLGIVQLIFYSGESSEILEV